MGLEINRFVKSSKIDKEFICSICRDVIHVPKQINSGCEHIFCYECITLLIENEKSLKCPNDRNPIEEPYFKSPSRYWLNSYYKLKIKCYYQMNGCRATVELEDLEKHEADCEYNLEAVVTCKKGCGTEMQRKALESHNCISYLRFLIEDLALSQPVSQSPKFCGSISDEINSIKNEVRNLKKRLDETIDRLNESLPKKCDPNTTIESSESTQSSPQKNYFLELNSDGCEKPLPPVKPRRIDPSTLKLTKIIKPKFYDLSNMN